MRGNGRRCGGNRSHHRLLTKSALAAVMVFCDASRAFTVPTFLSPVVVSKISSQRHTSTPREHEDCDYDTRNLPLSRRDAVLRSTIVVSAAIGTSASVSQISDALDLTSLLPFNNKAEDNGVYRQAKRATAYLVDSTIPPTLVPFRASREAAILKNIGMGYGTSKTPFLEEGLNLNNMMKKGVFGTIDFVADLTGKTKDSDKKNKGAGYASFVFLGMNMTDGEDVDLASGIITDIIKPRRGRDTALGLEFVPQSCQGALDSYKNGDSEQALIQALVDDAGVDRNEVEAQLPLLNLAKSKKLTLLALGPEPMDVRMVRKEGLQNLDLARRSRYVADSEGFIGLTQDPKYRLYTEKSLLKDFTPSSDESGDNPGDFFAERILVHEAVATAIAQYAILLPNSLVITVAPIKDVRFLGGPNGRLPRICRYFSPDTSIDEEAVTTILLNPSAQETLSQSKYLRLEIGTSPENLRYQTKIADYLWFSRMPKVNMLPRLMNGF